ncbi:MAG: hypothetical protein R3D30_11475 [Hyphomicrobiales bacterium]
MQAAHQGGEKLFSRTGDDISGAFPDVVEHCRKASCSTASFSSCVATRWHHSTACNNGSTARR